MNVTEIRHPDYNTMQDLWEQYRLTFEGGYDFVDNYLEKYTIRETSADFELRKEMTYCPAHAKAAIIDIKNAIYSRMVDISRNHGPESYRLAADGLLGGVDLKGRSINGFIGCVLLPELLSIGKVGVYIDKPILDKNALRSDTQDVRPYLYHYQAENILSWSYDAYQNLTAVLLKDHILATDEETGLATEEVEQYRLLKLNNGRVDVVFYDKDGVQTEQYTLELPRIPFVILQISQSLLTDVSDYQIALLNIASSDIHYILKANFPFYTEQYALESDFADMLTRQPKTGDAAAAKDDAKSRNINVGLNTGRRYGKGLERPAFIHPSSEPLLASMQKQEEMIKDIKRLVNTNVQNLEPRRASSESKAQDNKSKEEGLSYIGLELETAERQIVDIWALYDGIDNNYVVKYPTNYSLRTDDERTAEADSLKDLMLTLPSDTFKREVAKRIARILLGNKIGEEVLTVIDSEIESAPAIISDPESLRSDHEAGLVGTETASKLRGYPAGEVEKAKKDHADRAARIALAQSEAGARGVADMDSDPESGKKEKQQVKEEKING